MCPRHAALPVRQRRSWGSELAFERTPDSMMQGPCAPAGTWYWELCRDTRLAWSQVQCTALLGQAWVIDRYRSALFTVQNQLNGFFLSQHPVHISCSCTHWHMWVNLGDDYIWLEKNTFWNVICQYISPDMWSCSSRYKTTHTVRHHLGSSTMSWKAKKTLNKHIFPRNSVILVNMKCHLSVILYYFCTMYHIVPFWAFSVWSKHATCCELIQVWCEICGRTCVGNNTIWLNIACWTDDLNKSYMELTNWNSVDSLIQNV